MYTRAGLCLAPSPLEGNRHARTGARIAGPGKQDLGLGVHIRTASHGFRCRRALLAGIRSGKPSAIPLSHASVTSPGERFFRVFTLTTSHGWPRVLADFLSLGNRHSTVAIIMCALVVSRPSYFVLNLLVGVIADVLGKEQADLEYTGDVRSATVLLWNDVQLPIFSSNATAERTERRGAVNLTQPSSGQKEKDFGKFAEGLRSSHPARDHPTAQPDLSGQRGVPRRVNASKLG